MQPEDVVSFLRGRLFRLMLIGIAIRVLIGVVMNCNFDVAGWALASTNILSGEGLYGLDGYYYTPVWGYFLGFFSGFQDLFLSISSFGDFFPGASILVSNDVFGNAYVTNSAFNIALKCMLFAFDIIVAYLVYWLIDDVTEDRKKAETACAVWFLCPIVFLVSAVGGMFDVLMGVFLLLAIIMLRRDRIFMGGAFFALAVLLKMFPAFFLFPFVAYVWQKHRGSGDQVRCILVAAAGAVSAVAAALLPFICMGQISECLSFLGNRMGGGLGNDLSAAVGYLVVLMYAAVFTAIAYLSLRALRGSAVAEDRGFLALCALTACIILLFPSNQQYYLLLVPFLVIYFMLGAGELKLSLRALSAGAFTVLISGLTLQFLGFLQTFGIADIDSIAPTLGWLMEGDIPLVSVIAGFGLVILWLGTAYALYAVMRTGVNNGDLDCIPDRLADVLKVKDGSPARVRTEVAGSKGRHD